MVRTGARTQVHVSLDVLASKTISLNLDRVFPRILVTLTLVVKIKGKTKILLRFDICLKGKQTFFFGERLLCINGLLWNSLITVVSFYILIYSLNVAMDCNTCQFLVLCIQCCIIYISYSHLSSRHKTVFMCSFKKREKKVCWTFNYSDS